MARLLIKKGSVIHPVVIFVILNLVFVVLLLGFLYRSAGGGIIYEEIYAKELAFLIDGAEEGMVVTMDFEKGMEFIEDKKLDANSVVKINNELNEVSVSFGKGGYKMIFFSDLNVEARIEEGRVVLKFDGT